MTKHDSFDPILSDYTFFMDHSTEADRDVEALLPYLLSLRDRKSVSVLDFGSGNGRFTGMLLQQAQIPPGDLSLTLIEPGGESRFSAVQRLARFSEKEMEHWPAIPEEHPGFYDFILANHSLYYVPDLKKTVKQLNAMRQDTGILCIALAGKGNFLADLWMDGYVLAEKPFPFYIARDVERALDMQFIPFERHYVDYVITFSDSEENRLKILRFLFAGDLNKAMATNLLSAFDAYRHDEEVHIETSHLLFTVS